MARQAAMSMDFPRHESWSGLPFPFPGDLPDQGFKPAVPSTNPAALTSLFCLPGFRTSENHLQNTLSWWKKPRLCIISGALANHPPQFPHIPFAPGQKSICKYTNELELSQDWRRAWQSTPLFLPGDPHGQRNLAGYISQGRRVGRD